MYEYVSATGRNNTVVVVSILLTIGIVAYVPIPITMPRLQFTHYLLILENNVLYRSFAKKWRAKNRFDFFIIEFFFFATLHIFIYYPYELRQGILEFSDFEMKVVRSTTC